MKSFSLQAQQYLEEEKILFKEVNDGVQLTVEGPSCFIDYWPSTGKWITRENKYEGFGLKELIKYCNGSLIKGK